MTTDQADHRADPVQAVAEAIWALHDGAYLAYQAGADEALELARVAVEAARPAIEREAKEVAWDEGFDAGWWCYHEDDLPRNPYQIEEDFS